MGENNTTSEIDKNKESTTPYLKIKKWQKNKILIFGSQMS